jgi:hypothetical protein
MNRTTFACVLAAATALAGCSEDHSINAGGPGEDANHAAANANVQLPPSILESKIYRCKDNSIVYIDWLSDNKSANVRTEKTGTPTQVVAPEAGQAMVAEGYSLTGTATAASINLTLPGKGAETCKA